MRNSLLRPLAAVLRPVLHGWGSGPRSEEEAPLRPFAGGRTSRNGPCRPRAACASPLRTPGHRRLFQRHADHYLDALDPQRAYFLEGDIAQFERYRYTLDDALRRGDLAPAFEIFNRYQAAAETQLQSLLRLLESGIEALDFSDDEYLAMDRSEEPFLTNADTREDLGRRRLKASVLSLKLAEKADDEIGPLLEKRATEIAFIA